MTGPLDSSYLLRGLVRLENAVAIRLSRTRGHRDRQQRIEEPHLPIEALMSADPQPHVVLWLVQGLCVQPRTVPLGPSEGSFGLRV